MMKKFFGGATADVELVPVNQDPAVLALRQKREEAQSHRKAMETALAAFGREAVTFASLKARDAVTDATKAERAAADAALQAARAAATAILQARASVERAALDAVAEHLAATIAALETYEAARQETARLNEFYQFDPLAAHCGEFQHYQRDVLNAQLAEAMARLEYKRGVTA